MFKTKNFILGWEFSTAVDWRVYSRWRQALSLCKFSHNQGQASTDQTLAFKRCRLRPWCIDATRSSKDSFRRRSTAASESCWTCHDYGPIIWWCMLRRYRYRSWIKVSQGSWQSGVQQSTKLHCSHLRAICSVTTRRHWQEGEHMCIFLFLLLPYYISEIWVSLSESQKSILLSNENWRPGPYW